MTSDDVKGVKLPQGGDGATEQSGVVRVISVKGNEIRFEVDATNESVFVVANSYNRRWTATVNGISRKVFPVYNAFQGMVVGKGRSEVVLKYTSEVWRLLGHR